MNIIKLFIASDLVFYFYLLLLFVFMFFMFLVLLFFVTFVRLVRFSWFTCKMMKCCNIYISQVMRKSMSSFKLIILLTIKAICTIWQSIANRKHACI